MISIYALAAMFIIATILPINMGVLAFVGAFLVGTLVAGMQTKGIMAGFPAELFLTLVGITFLFAQAQNNGTIDALVRLALRAVGGRVAAIPWIMFGIAALLTAVGAVSPAAVAIIAPIALGFAAKHGINPLMMGLLVIHGAQAGGFSPISIYGGITNKIVQQAGLPLSPLTTAFASFGVNFAVALLLFLLFGGFRLMRPAKTMPGRTSTGIGLATKAFAVSAPVPAQGRQVVNDAEGEALTEERLAMARSSQSVPGAGAGSAGSGAAAPATDISITDKMNIHQLATIAGLVALAILTLVYKLDIGFVAITIGLVLSVMAPNVQKRAISQVSWPEIMLIVGVSTYVGVMEKMGTISFVGNSVASLTSPMVAALLLCFVGAVISAFASSTAVLGSLIPLAVPFLQQGTGVDAIGFIAAMAVSSTIVDVSPFSTNGALVLANAQGVDREVFLRHLMIYGAIITIAAPVVVWLRFIVL
jgi:di/tricarboxylate transporter